MHNYEKAVRARYATYAASKLKVFEPLLTMMMAGAELTTNQIAARYDLHRSTARSYREQLVKAGAIRLNRNIALTNVACEGAYVINSVEMARAFLDELRSGRNISRNELSPKNVSPLLPGTRIHCASDDNEVPMRKMCNEKVEVRRDPWDLAFFGNGPARSVQIAVEAA